ncbi:MAG: DUF4124 domain-containing protein [Xanthomonadales bacterium]|nr:hypothetical protein [Xanthomonadales bacterium]MCC6592018.1 DUF4124 domain-containing protein [Xanthomonadales bacterium]
MRWTTILWISCGVLGLCAQALAADKPSKMYKWTDADGTVHYSAKPPEEGQTQEVQLRRGPTLQSAPAATVDAPDANKLARCTQLRENLRLLEANSPDLQISENGLTRPLKTEERALQTEATRKALEDCAGVPEAAPAG